MTRARLSPFVLAACGLAACGLAACGLAACKSSPAAPSDAPRAWSPAVHVNARADARSVALAVDAQGRAVLTWVSVDERGARAMAATERAEGAAGAAWTVEELSRGLDGRSSAPSIAAGPSGRALAAWTQSDERGAASAVFVRERTGDAWSAAEALSLPPDAYEPEVAMTAAGDAYVVWSQGGDAPYSVQLAQKRAGDAAWDRPAGTEARLSPRALSANQPRLAAADGGALLVTWYQSPDNGPLMTFMSERRGGAARPARAAVDAFVSPRGGLVDLPVPALGPNGSAAVAWTQESPKGARSVFVATRDAGTWSRPADRDAPRAAANAARAPLVAFGPAGDLYVAWGERAPERAIFALYRSASGAWDAAPTRLSDPAADAIDPAMAIGPDGEVVVVWSQAASNASSSASANGTSNVSDNARGARTWRAMAATSRAGAARATPSTRQTARPSTWGAPVALSDEGSNAVAPVVAIAPAGRARGRVIVAWTETRADAPAAPGFVTTRALQKNLPQDATRNEAQNAPSPRSLAELPTTPPGAPARGAPPLAHVSAAHSPQDD